jgi:hypothetical protein
MEEHGSSIDVAQRWVEAMEDSDLDSVMPLYDTETTLHAYGSTVSGRTACASTCDRRRSARSCSWRSGGTTVSTSLGAEATMSRWRPHSVSQEVRSPSNGCFGPGEVER